MAHLLPLLSPAVNPDAKAHEDDPAGSANARDEGRLLDHVRNLLGQTHAALVPTVAGAAAAAWSRGLFSWQFWREGTRKFISETT